MKALLIGYGSIGKRHERVLKKLGFDCIDIVSKQQLNHKRVYAKLEDVPELSSYDYYLIASVTSLHYKQLSFLNEHLCDKEIFVEKPVFDNRYPPLLPKNHIWVGYNMRWERSLRFLKQALFGKKVIFALAYVGQYLPQWHPWADYRKSYSALKSKGGGVALDLSHEIDYLQWLIGPILSLCSIKAKISDLDIETDDIFTFIGRTENGAIINCTMDYINKIAQRILILHTEDETWSVEYISGKIELNDKNGNRQIFNKSSNDSDESYFEMHKAILEGRTEDVCNLNQALATLDICLGGTRKCTEI